MSIPLFDPSTIKQGSSILITGGIRSGKTTLMYDLLNKLGQPVVNISDIDAGTQKIMADCDVLRDIVVIENEWGDGKSHQFPHNILITEPYKALPSNFDYLFILHGSRVMYHPVQDSIQCIPISILVSTYKIIAYTNTYGYAYGCMVIHDGKIYRYKATPSAPMFDIVDIKEYLCKTKQNMFIAMLCNRRSHIYPIDMFECEVPQRYYSM